MTGGPEKSSGKRGYMNQDVKDKRESAAERTEWKVPDKRNRLCKVVKQRAEGLRGSKRKPEGPEDRETIARIATGAGGAGGTQSGPDFIGSRS